MTDQWAGQKLWAVCALTSTKPKAIAYFHLRGDAENHLKWVRRTAPGLNFSIIWLGG